MEAFSTYVMRVPESSARPRPCIDPHIVNERGPRVSTRPAYENLAATICVDNVGIEKIAQKLRPA